MKIGQICHDNILSETRMNEAVVGFLKSAEQVSSLIESGIFVKETDIPIHPLSAPANRVTISNVPAFIENESHC